MNRLVPLMDIICYSEKDNIWKGTVIEDTEQKQSLGGFVFFSRNYDPSNELDRVLREYHFPADPDVKNVEFWLIPVEKTLFVFSPASMILQPMPGQFPQRRRMQ